MTEARYVFCQSIDYVFCQSIDYGTCMCFFVNRRQQLDPSEHWASVPGQAKIAGMDHVLDAADDFKMGAGSHMGKAERTALLAPDVHPIAPGKKSAKEVSLF